MKKGQKLSEREKHILRLTREKNKAYNAICNDRRCNNYSSESHGSNVAHFNNISIVLEELKAMKDEEYNREYITGPLPLHLELKDLQSQIDNLEENKYIVQGGRLIIHLSDPEEGLSCGWFFSTVDPEPGRLFIDLLFNDESFDGLGNGWTPENFRKTRLGLEANRYKIDYEVFETYGTKGIRPVQINILN